MNENKLYNFLIIKKPNIFKQIIEDNDKDFQSDRFVEWEALDGDDFTFYRPYNAGIKRTPIHETYPSDYSKILTQRITDRLPNIESIDMEYEIPELQFKNLLGPDHITKYKRFDDLEPIVKKFHGKATSLSVFTPQFKYIKVQQKDGKYEYQVMTQDQDGKQGEFLTISVQEANNINKRLGYLFNAVFDNFKDNLIPEEGDREQLKILAERIKMLIFNRDTSAKDILENLTSIINDDPILGKYQPLLATVNEILIEEQEGDEPLKFQLIDQAQKQAPHIIPSGEYKKAIDRAEVERIQKSSNPSAIEDYLKSKLVGLQDLIFRQDKKFATGLFSIKVERPGPSGKDIEEAAVTPHIKKILDIMEDAQIKKISWFEAAKLIDKLVQERIALSPKNRTRDAQLLYKYIKSTLFSDFQETTKNSLIELKDWILKENWKDIVGQEERDEIILVDGNNKVISKTAASVLKEIAKVESGKESPIDVSEKVIRILIKAKNKTPRQPSLFYKPDTLINPEELKKFNSIMLEKALGFQKPYYDYLQAIYNTILNTDWVVPHGGDRVNLTNERGERIEKGVPHTVHLILKQMEKVGIGELTPADAYHQIIKTTTASLEVDKANRDLSSQIFYFNVVNHCITLPEISIKETLERLDLRLGKPMTKYHSKRIKNLENITQGNYENLSFLLKNMRDTGVINAQQYRKYTGQFSRNNCNPSQVLKNLKTEVIDLQEKCSNRLNNFDLSNFVDTQPGILSDYVRNFYNPKKIPKDIQTKLNSFNENPLKHLETLINHLGEGNLRKLFTMPVSEHDERFNETITALLLFEMICPVKVEIEKRRRGFNIIIGLEHLNKVTIEDTLNTIQQSSGIKVLGR